MLGLLRTPKRLLDRVWSGLEDLPFAWHLVPLRDWVSGALTWFEWSSDHFGERELPLGHLSLVGEFAGPRLRGSEFVFNLIRGFLDSRREHVLSSLSLLASPESHAPRVDAVEDARRQLNRDIEARAELMGSRRYTWPSGPLTSRLVEVSAQLVPDLADLCRRDSGFKVPLLNAPIIAALSTAAPDQLTPERWSALTDLEFSRRELLFELRLMREQAPRWYDECFEHVQIEAMIRRRMEIFGDPQ